MNYREAVEELSKLDKQIRREKPTEDHLKTTEDYLETEDTVVLCSIQTDVNKRKFKKAFWRFFDHIIENLLPISKKEFTERAFMIIEGIDDQEDVREQISQRVPKWQKNGNAAIQTLATLSRELLKRKTLITVPQ